MRPLGKDVTNSIPSSFEDWATTKAAYWMLSNDRVDDQTAISGVPCLILVNIMRRTWFHSVKRSGVPSSGIHAFCFPYAGGSATSLRPLDCLDSTFKCNTPSPYEVLPWNRPEPIPT